MAYRNSVVTFLDILGFRSVVSTLGMDDISSMLDAVATSAGGPLGSDEDAADVLLFSDSVIRARRAKPESWFDALVQELGELATAQWNLLERHILVRGGITVGKIAMAPGRAFGPAFVRAYELESSVAGAPRIVLDPAVVQSIREHIKAAGSVEEKRALIDKLKRHVRLGDDGLWFVDYIASVGGSYGDKAKLLKALLRFRSFIIEKTNALDARAPHLSKYLWLVRYHNLAARRLLPDKRSLKIKNSDVPAADELLRPKIQSKS